MKIRVEFCWAGNNNYRIRFTAPDGRRSVMCIEDGEDWTRSLASRALNHVAYDFGIRRDRIRFDHC